MLTSGSPIRTSIDDESSPMFPFVLGFRTNGGTTMVRSGIGGGGLIMGKY